VTQSRGRFFDDGRAGKLVYALAVVMAGSAAAMARGLPVPSLFVAIGGVLLTVFGMLLSNRAGRGPATIFGGLLLVAGLLIVGFVYLFVNPPLPANG